MKQINRNYLTVFLSACLMASTGMAYCNDAQIIPETAVQEAAKSTTKGFQWLAENLIVPGISNVFNGLKSITRGVAENSLGCLADSGNWIDNNILNTTPLLATTLVISCMYIGSKIEAPRAENDQQSYFTKALNYAGPAAVLIIMYATGKTLLRK